MTELLFRDFGLLQLSVGVLVEAGEEVGGVIGDSQSRRESQ